MNSKLEKKKNVGWFRISLLNGWFTIEPQKHNEFVDPCGRPEKVFFGACFFRLVLKEPLYLGNIWVWGNGKLIRFPLWHIAPNIIYSQNIHDFNFNYQPFSMSKTRRFDVFFSTRLIVVSLVVSWPYLVLRGGRFLKPGILKSRFADRCGGNFGEVFQELIFFKCTMII